MGSVKTTPKPRESNISHPLSVKRRLRPWQPSASYPLYDKKRLRPRQSSASHSLYEKGGRGHYYDLTMIKIPFKIQGDQMINTIHTLWSTFSSIHIQFLIGNCIMFLWASPTDCTIACAICNFCVKYHYYKMLHRRRVLWKWPRESSIPVLNEIIWEKRSCSRVLYEIPPCILRYLWHIR